MVAARTRVIRFLLPLLETENSPGNVCEFSSWANRVPRFSTLLGVNCLDAQEGAIITYTFPL